MFANASLATRIEVAEAGLIAEAVRAPARRVPPEQIVLREINGAILVK
ncbi:MAG TPA: hypothetical protein VGD94_19140 [Vicinamibacterales bacterium]